MTTQPGGDTDADAELGRTTTLTPEEIARRRARELATDNGDASHQGGAGAQGGQADFGLPKNFS
ncbi:MAG: hypothetical protein ABW128_08740 [Rhizorhabdus sp.]